jgi:universal stress protein A
MAYAHLLVPLDFSPASTQVIQRALEVARPFGARLALLHAVDYLPPLSFADDFTPSPVVAVDEAELVERAQGALDKLAEQFGLTDEVPRLVVVGAPKEEIVRVAAERGADLIVIGSHGRRRGLGRLLGTTASAVLNDAACDVLAVRIRD